MFLLLADLLLLFRTKETEDSHYLQPVKGLSGAILLRGTQKGSWQSPRPTKWRMGSFFRLETGHVSQCQIWARHSLRSQILTGITFNGRTTFPEMNTYRATSTLSFGSSSAAFLDFADETGSYP